MRMHSYLRQCIIERLPVHSRFLRRLNARKTLRLQQSSAEHDPSLPVVIPGTDRRSRVRMRPGQMVRLRVRLAYRRPLTSVITPDFGRHSYVEGQRALRGFI